MARGTPRSEHDIAGHLDKLIELASTPEAMRNDYKMQNSFNILELKLVET